jgi:branched-chain amino acid aminotransferase
VVSQLVCIDGVLMDAADARISVTDEGLLRGDGVFEVIRLYGGRPFALERHIERLGRSAAGLRLPLDLAAVRSDVQLALSSPDAPGGDGLLRVLATRGGRRIAIHEPLPTLPAKFALGAVTYAPVRLLDEIKSLSYGANMLASRLARERGFDEALFVTPHGRVLECPTASFFAVIDGQLRTAPLSDHVLDSITRAVVLDAADVAEVPITLDDLRRADEAFIASSVVEIAPVARIETIELEAPGARTSAVATHVAQYIRSQLAP